MDREIVAETARELIEAQEYIVQGLGPIVDDWLKIFHGSPDFIQKEDQWRQQNLKGRESDPLQLDARGGINWDFSVLLETMTRGRWDRFINYQRHQRKQIIANKQELYLDIKRLQNLRDKIGHRTLGKFSWEDYREFFVKGERVLRSVGAEKEARMLQSRFRERPSEPRITTIGDLKFRHVLTYPQWASEPTIIALPEYGVRSILAEGRFSSKSPYFRFGFKLMRQGQKLFSPGSIQTEEQNMVLHIGKNAHDDDLFVTTYKNGMRLAPNKVVMAYNKDTDIFIGLEGTREQLVKLRVCDQLAYETFFQIDGPAQLVILAWGDEFEFECQFKQVKIITT